MKEKTCIACRKRPTRFGHHYCSSCSAVDGEVVATLADGEEPETATSSASNSGARVLVPLVCAGVLLVLIGLVLILLHIMGEGSSLHDMMATW